MIFTEPATPLASHQAKAGQTSTIKYTRASVSIRGLLVLRLSIYLPLSFRVFVWYFTYHAILGFVWKQITNEPREHIQERSTPLVRGKCVTSDMVIKSQLFTICKSRLFERNVYRNTNKIQAMERVALHLNYNCVSRFGSETHKNDIDFPRKVLPIRVQKPRSHVFFEVTDHLDDDDACGTKRKSK